jgi:hypothetical protein
LLSSSQFLLLNGQAFASALGTFLCIRLARFKFLLDLEFVVPFVRIYLKGICRRKIIHPQKAIHLHSVLEKYKPGFDPRAIFPFTFSEIIQFFCPGKA